MRDPTVSHSVYTVTLDRTLSETHDLDGTLLGTQIDEFKYDEWGNAVTAVTKRSDKTSVETKSAFENDDTQWLLGRLKQSIVTLTGEDGATLTRRANFEYDPLSGLVTKEVSYAGTPQAVTTNYAYDKFGSTSGATTSAADITTRSSRVEFDERGRFPIRQINALGHTSSTEYDPVFGLPTKVTDVNGVFVTSDYDSHGRRVKSRSPTRIEERSTTTGYRTEISRAESTTFRLVLARCRPPRSMT